jgi:hypothetical protein
VQVRNFLKTITSIVLILSITACEADPKDHLLHEKMVLYENKINELQTEMDVIKVQNLEQQEVLSQKESELTILKNSIDFDLMLTNSNIEDYYGSFNEGLWGVGGHLYSGYIKTIYQRLLFKENYLWMEGGKIDFNPIEKYLHSEQSQNHLFGLRFVNPVTSKVNSFPQNIKEVWLYGLNDNNKVFILNKDVQWFAYDIYDSNLKADFRVLQSILKSYDEWLKDSVR